MPAVDVEAVRPEAHGDPAGFLGDRPDLGAERAQDLVAEVAPVQRVDRVELLDVQHDGVARHLGVLAAQAVGVLEEVVAVEQARQRVGLRRANQRLGVPHRAHVP